MKLWDNPKKLFKAKVPDIERYIGCRVTIPTFGVLDGKRELISQETVTIQHICGNRFKQQFYEINGTHLISMLRFHAQMEKAYDITEEQFQQFEEMEVAAEKLAEDPKEEKHG